MKLISKEHPSTLKDPRVCVHHFHPSTLCTAASTIQLLPGACFTINVTTEFPKENKNMPRFVMDQSFTKQISNNTCTDARKENDGHCMILENGQNVDTDRFQCRHKREELAVEDAV